MRKIKQTLILFWLALLPAFANDASQQYESLNVKINATCSKIGSHSANTGQHRTPPVAPEVYLDTEHSILLFGMPCFESTLQLVIPGTDTSVYTYVIPDGDTEVQLPTSLSGEYELHIHRGNYCFCGVIELP